MTKKPNFSELCTCGKDMKPVREFIEKYYVEKKQMLQVLKKIQKILNNYHSELPLIEVGRQNVLNDIDNEVGLDKLIEKLSEVRK